MESYKSERNEIKTEDMGKKVLIATLYSPEPVILATTRLGPERLILLIERNPIRSRRPL